MTNSEFGDDLDFDPSDISSILKDIDSANLALDAVDQRAEKLRANIMSLLQAQSQPNPYSNFEAEPLEGEDATHDKAQTSIGSTESVQKPNDSIRASPNSTINDENPGPSGE
ncbi:hypothetical protein BX616_009095 [Lobosporangium transversale]|nr:hypothetical protein BX616_009095 [Lobosporangium transversale]